MRAAGPSVWKCAALALLFLAISVTVVMIAESSDDSSAETVYDKNIIYETTDEVRTFIVVGLIDDTVTSVEIKDAITHNSESYKVIGIKEDTFKDNTNLQSIRLSANTLTIGQNAFKGCTSLKEITIPESVVTIADYAFAGSGIEKADIQGKMEELSAHIFDGCLKLKSIQLPDSLLTIREMALNNCPVLTELTIPSGVLTIEKNAFSHCISLQKVQIPSGTTFLGDAIFYDCPSITEITMPSVSYVPASMFSGCTALREVDMNKNIIEIRSEAFYGCSSLSKITLFESVTSVGDNAFAGCSSLSVVEMTSNVVSVGSHAFSSCSGLTYLTIPPTLTSMGKSVFGSTVFYDQAGQPITDQSKLPGHSYELRNSKMQMCDGCYYTMSFDVDGGSTKVDDTKADYASSFVLPTYEGLKEGFVFAGWSCEGKSYAIGETFTMPGHSVSLKAIWNTYVPPQEDKGMINEDNVKFFGWAIVSIVFTVIIILFSTIIIYLRRH